MSDFDKLKPQIIDIEGFGGKWTPYKDYQALEQKNQKLKSMIDNGLGWSDMVSDGARGEGPNEALKPDTKDTDFKKVDGIPYEGILLDRKEPIDRWVSVLKECGEILAKNNWRGDLVEKINELSTPPTQD